MIVNFSNKNPYKDFIKVGGQSFVSSNITPALSSAQVASVKVADVQDNDKNKGNGKKIFGIIGISLGSVALLSIIGLFTLSKGFSSSVSQKFSKWSKSLQKKIYELSTETKELTTSQKMKLRLSKALQPFADTMQASSNITSVKDSWFRHWSKKFGFEPLINKLNNVFKNVVTKNTRNYYMKAEKANLQFCSYLDDLIQKSTDTKIKMQLQQYADQLKLQFRNTFSTAEHYERTNNAFKKMYGLDEKVYEKLFGNGGMFKNIKKYKTYVTMDLIEPERKALAKMLLENKARLSNNVNDNYINIKRLLNEITISVNPKDKKSVEIIEKLGKTLENYRTVNGPQEAEMRNKLISAFKEEIVKLSEILKSDIQYKSVAKNIDSRVSDFLKSINPNVAKKGLAQDTITHIKEIYGKDSVQYKHAKKLVAKLNTTLNTAITSELQAYEKLAELQVGSLMTDILGILGPTALGTILVVNSKDKNERISKTLTQGIPIIGGVGVSYYGTTRGWTGAKNLIIGLTTGYLLNVIGSKINDLYKKYAEKQSILKTAYDAWNKLQHKNNTEKLSVNVQK